MKNFAKQYTIDGATSSGDPKTFLLTVKPTIIQFLNEHRNIKLEAILKCIMSKTNISTGEVEYTVGFFASKVEIALQGTDLDDLYRKIMDKILESLAAFQMRGSNWIFESIDALDIHTVKYEPLGGSSYIPLPKALSNKKAIINMQNDDEECFKWCVTRALYPVSEHPERITKILREQAQQLNWDGIEFPLELQKIDRFERQNDVGVNLFAYEWGVYPLRISELGGSASKRINLLLISNSDKQHYCLINNMSRLLSSQKSKKKCKKFFCLRCLNTFGTQKLLDEHEEYCKNNEAVRIDMPKEENSILSFKNLHRKIPVPFVIYADFESLIIPIHTTQPFPKESYTNKIQIHKPSFTSFCYYIKCNFDDKYSKLVEYTATSEDEDVAQKFTDMLEYDTKRIYDQFKDEKQIIWGKKEEREPQSGVGYVVGVSTERIEKYAIIVIILGNIEVLRITIAILNAANRNLFRLYFTTCPVMTLTYLSKISV